MSKIIISSNLAVSENGFLFMPLTGESFTLNPIGKLILTALKEGNDQEQVIKLIIDEYDIDKSSAEKDLEDFISQLKNHKLITEQ
jgi:hypothetical protein